jgi:large subunit ribosomal protein L27Ae
MRERYLKEKPKDTAPVIDLLQFGYAKLLGAGRIPEIPVVVKARYVSKEAERKITEAGGKIQLVA